MTYVSQIICALLLEEQSGLYSYSFPDLHLKSKKERGGKGEGKRVNMLVCRFAKGT